MSTRVDELRGTRQDVWRRAMALAERAAGANRSFRPDEQDEYERLTDRIAAIDEQLDASAERADRNRQTERKYAFLDSAPAPRSSLTGLFGGGGHDELRGFLRGEGPRIFELAPSPVDVRAIQQRALSTAVGSEGGDTVPRDFYAQLVEHLVAASPIMRVATVLRTDGGNPMPVPKTTAHSSASIVTEGSAITESDPAFGQVTFGGHKYGTFVQISRELLDDNGVDLPNYLARETGQAIGLAFGSHAATGSGTNQPRGYATDATVGVTGGTGLPPTYDDLVDLHYSVIPAYRQSRSTVWMANDATIAELRKLTDDNNQPIMTPNFDGSQFSLFGKPVLSDPNVPDVASGAKSLLFGDFSRYFVRMAGGVRFERSDDFAFQRDLISYRALSRLDSALIDLTGAIKAYASA